MTLEKVTSFSLRHLTLSIVWFLLTPVSFWNSGGGGTHHTYKFLEGKECIMLFLMAFNTTQLLTKVGHPVTFRFEAGVCQVGRVSDRTQQEGDF